MMQNELIQNKQVIVYQRVNDSVVIEMEAEIKRLLERDKRIGNATKSHHLGCVKNTSARHINYATKAIKPSCDVL